MLLLSCWSHLLLLNFVYNKEPIVSWHKDSLSRPAWLATLSSGLFQSDRIIGMHYYIKAYFKHWLVYLGSNLGKQTWLLVAILTEMLTVMLTSKITGEVPVCFSGFNISPFSNRKIRCHPLNFHVRGVWRSISRAFGRHWILLAPSFSCSYHMVCSLCSICLPLGQLDSSPFISFVLPLTSPHAFSPGSTV